MPSITPRKNKDGDIISYTIRVYHGYDSQGKRLKPYTMTYKPAPNMTTKQIEKELQKISLDFEERCKKGIAGNAERITLEEFSKIYLESKVKTLYPAFMNFMKEPLKIKYFRLSDFIK